MHIRLLILSLLFGLSLAVSGQDDDTRKLLPSDLARARVQINQIHSRGIIVRLQTDQNRIKALRANGYMKTAQELAEKDTLTNMILCYAFITRWAFAPVYFMESQHSRELYSDSLIALTWDLQRDTLIHIDHDSMYIVDYGDIMENIHGPGNTTAVSSTPLAGKYLVTKGSNLEQLTEPLPYYAKVWGNRKSGTGKFGDPNSSSSSTYQPPSIGGIPSAPLVIGSNILNDKDPNTDLLQPIVIPADLADSIAACLSAYTSTHDMIRSGYKNALARYFMTIYDHVHVGSIPQGSQKPKLWYTSLSDAADRFNEHFIQYYCKRLDKDKNIVSSDDPIYWWLRNPNIRYLPYLHDLELRLKQKLDTKEKFTPTR